MTGQIVRAVVWSISALAELETAIATIRADNPKAAQALYAAVESAVAQLAKHNVGRRGRVPDTFEKSLPRWRRVIAYTYEMNSDGQEELQILHIIHTSRDWPSGHWPK